MRSPRREKRHRAEGAEVAIRVEEILRIRLDGAQFHDVVQFSAEKGWGLQERQIRNYIRRADNLLVERQQTKRQRVVALHIARRESLFARAVNASDPRAALAILSDLAKLQGLYPSDKELAAQREQLNDQGKQSRLTHEEAIRIAREAAIEVKRMEPDASRIVLKPPEN